MHVLVRTSSTISADLNLLYKIIFGYGSRVTWTRSLHGYVLTRAQEQCTNNNPRTITVRILVLRVTAVWNSLPPVFEWDRNEPESRSGPFLDGRNAVPVLLRPPRLMIKVDSQENDKKVATRCQI